MLNKKINNMDDIKLSEAKIDINVKNERNKSPLMIAVEKGDINTVNSLFAEEVNLEARDSDDRTALIYAIQKDNEKIAKMLLDEGANINARILWVEQR